MAEKTDEKTEQIPPHETPASTVQTAKFHDAISDLHGKRLAAAASPRAGQRHGVNQSEVDRMARMLAEGASWDEVKFKFKDVVDSALEGWKAEVHRLAGLKLESIVPAPAPVEPTPAAPAEAPAPKPPKQPKAAKPPKPPAGE